MRFELGERQVVGGAVEPRTPRAPSRAGDAIAARRRESLSSSTARPKLDNHRQHGLEPATQASAILHLDVAVVH